MTFEVYYDTDHKDMCGFGLPVCIYNVLHSVVIEHNWQAFCISVHCACRLLYLLTEKSLSIAIVY